MPIGSTVGRSLADRLRDGARTIRPGRGRSSRARRHRPSLGAPVGFGRPNRQADVRTVESLLRETGDVARSSHPPTGLFGGFLRDATRDFQRRNRLTVDGILEPDGETFDALRQPSARRGGDRRVAQFDAEECQRLRREIIREKDRLDNILVDIEEVSGKVADLMMRRPRDPEIDKLQDGLAQLHGLRLRQERVVAAVERRLEGVCVSST